MSDVVKRSEDHQTATTPDAEGDPPETEPMGSDDADLSVPYWLTSTEEAANTTFLRMVRRLPKLLREAWRRVWRALPGC
jgi:ATP-binding cassette subfamily B protein